MKKSNLRTGHVVTLRNGDSYMVFRNCMYHNAKDIIVNKNNSWFYLNDFNEDLTFNDEEAWCIKPHIWDIVKVETTSHPYALVKEFGTNKTVWKEERKKMTVSEIEKILGYKVEIIAEK